MRIFVIDDAHKDVFIREWAGELDPMKITRWPTLTRLGTMLWIFASAGCGESDYHEEICGGAAKIGCPEDKYCYFYDRACGTKNGIGTCVFRPQRCEIEGPVAGDGVCACDGHAYIGRCSANISGSDMLNGCVP